MCSDILHSLKIRHRVLAAAQHLCRRKKMNDILILAFEYMKIGAVAIGGGYTVIPFLYYLVDK